MVGQLMPPDQVAAAIREGRRLLLAGDERIMTWMPAGDWIGGSIPNVVTTSGAQRTNRSIYVDELPDAAQELRLVTYTSSTIEDLYRDAPHHGFTVVIIPAKSKTMLRFALDAERFPGFGTTPVIGWVSGVDLGEIGRTPARIFNGANPTPLADGAVAMHVELPPRMEAQVGQVNMFTPDTRTEITFPQDGFGILDATVNGKAVRFVDYLQQIGHDLRLPLITRRGDALVNVSFERSDKEAGRVHLYKPVFAETVYYLAKPIADYAKTFAAAIEHVSSNDVCFNCILNYQYGCFMGQNTSRISFPCTFGEIAQRLLSQTLVHLHIGKKSPEP